MNPGSTVTTIIANDVDTSPALVYDFKNISHPHPFSIDHFCGRIILTDKLDAEARSEYILQVIASDSIHEVMTELTVRIADLNDNPPQFTQIAFITTLLGMAFQFF